MEGHYLKVAVNELDEMTPETLKIRTPPFFINFGVDILTTYECNVTKREEKIGQCLEIIWRKDSQYLIMKNAEPVAKSEIREIIKKIIEKEHAIRKKI